MLSSSSIRRSIVWWGWWRWHVWHVRHWWWWHRWRWHCPTTSRWLPLIWCLLMRIIVARISCLLGSTATSSEESLQLVGNIRWSASKELTVGHFVGNVDILRLMMMITAFNVLLLFEFFYFLHQQIDLFLVNLCFVIFSRFCRCRARCLCARLRLI